MKSGNPNKLDIKSSVVKPQPVAGMEDWKLVRLKLLGISRVLALDPEWKLCCVACKCFLPSNEVNVVSHLSGKKHRKNANKLTALELVERKKKVAHPKDQASNSTCDDTGTSENSWFIARQRSSIEELRDISLCSVDPYDLSTSTMNRKFDLLFDKSKFLDSILSGREESSICVEEENGSAGLSAGSRAEGFRPLDFPAFSGTTFFTSMPPETRQPHHARRIREFTESEIVQKKHTGFDLSHKLSDAQGYLSLTSNDNEGSCYKPEVNEYTDEKMPPWVISPETVEAITHSKCKTLILHYEILEFCRFMSPTKIESVVRKRIRSTIRNIAEALWPESKVLAFGSYATGLYLPSSDIDLSVLNTPDSGSLDELKNLARAVRNLKGFARRVRIVQAKVGIVKLVSRDGNVACDVSIGQISGVKNVSLIRSYLRDYPALRPLVLVIKCFLEQRGLNDACTGGLGSYSILILVVSHLQMLRHNYPDIELNLGAVLIEFFDLYGWLFNLCSTGVAVKENGSYYDKVKRYCTQADETLRFSMEDPNDLDNEIGRNSRCSALLRRIFQDAYMSLSLWRRDDPSHSISPLSRIIAIDTGFKERRIMVTRDLETQNLVELTKYIVRNVSIASPTSGC